VSLWFYSVKWLCFLLDRIPTFHPLLNLSGRIPKLYVYAHIKMLFYSVSLGFVGGEFVVSSLLGFVGGNLL